MPGTNATSDGTWFNQPGLVLLELVNFTTSDALRRDVRRVRRDARERRKLTVELLGSVRSIYRTGLVQVSPCAQAYRARGKRATAKSSELARPPCNAEKERLGPRDPTQARRPLLGRRPP